MPPRMLDKRRPITDDQRVAILVETLPTELQLEIVTPQRPVVQESVSAVSLPGKDGYLGILPGHAPLLTELKTGELAYSRGDRTQRLNISGGFAEVLPNRVTVLAQSAEELSGSAPAKPGETPKTS